MENKVFLGGTCAGTDWRNNLIPSLVVKYFDPVVEDWTLECQVEENYQKDTACNIHLYVITKDMIGVYSIAEVVDSTSKEGKITILHVIPDGFEAHALKSLKATVALVRSKGGIAFIDSDLDRSARVINSCFKE